MYFITDAMTGGWPNLTAADRKMIERRNPSQMLVLSANGDQVPAALHALSPYDPDVVRTKLFRSGWYRVHAWLLTVHVDYGP